MTGKEQYAEFLAWFFEPEEPPDFTDPELRAEALRRIDEMHEAYSNKAIELVLSYLRWREGGEVALCDDFDRSEALLHWAGEIIAHAPDAEEIRFRRDVESIQGLTDLIDRIVTQQPNTVTDEDQKDWIRRLFSGGSNRTLH